MRFPATVPAHIDALASPCPVVFLSGDIDIVNAAAFAEWIEPVAELASQSLTLDLSGMSYIDAMGLGALVGITLQLPVKSHLVLQSPQPHVRRLLAITELDRLWSVDE
jgi:anti-sigma B factor antagonist